MRRGWFDVSPTHPLFFFFFSGGFALEISILSVCFFVCVQYILSHCTFLSWLLSRIFGFLLATSFF